MYEPSATLEASHAALLREALGPQRMFSRHPGGHEDRFLALRSAEARPLTTLGVGRAALSSSPIGFERGSPSRLTHKIWITLEGEGFVESLGQRLRLQPGTVAVCAAGRPCRYGTERGVWRRLWLGVADVAHWGEISRRGLHCEPSDLTGRLEAAALAMLEELGACTPSGSTPAHDDSATHANRPAAIFPDEYGWAGPQGAPIGAESAAGELHARLLRVYLHRALRIADDPSADREGQELERLWTRVRDTLHEGWSVERIAQELHVSQATLHRTMQRRYGTTPGAMLAQVRMEQARRFLVWTHEPLKQIAAQLGYANPFAFTNSFKARTGISPSAFRARAARR